MSNVLNQETFNKKTMIEDARGRIIPQHYDTTAGIFKPNTNGFENEANRTNESNNFQSGFSRKNLLVDKKRRPIPQYYDESEGIFKPITQNNSGQSDDFGKFQWVYNEETKSLDLVIKP